MKKDLDLGLKPVGHGLTQTVLTNRLQLADILEWILRQSGPARIWQSTFSVSEEFLRRLFHLRNQGLVTQASLIIDHKASDKTVKLWIFISQVFEHSFMSDNHSKILLIEAKSGHRIALVSSQNLTRGNRFESTMISEEPGIFRNLLDAFVNIQKYYSVPLDELLSTAAEKY